MGASSMPRFLPLAMLCLLPLAATLRLGKARRCDGSNATEECDPEPQEHEEALRVETPPLCEGTNATQDDCPPEVELPFNCKMKNITDKSKCGSTLNPNETCLGLPCTRLSPNLGCSQCWIAKTCEVEDKCPFRIRLFITGTFEIFSVRHLAASIAYDKHELTGNKLVTDWFAWFPLTRNFLISTAITLGNEFFQRELPNVRPQLIDYIGEALKDPNTLANLDFTTRLGIGRNVSKFVELIPDVTLRTKIDAETGAMDTEITIPQMTDHTTMAACDFLGGGDYYWRRAAAFSAVGALFGWRYPRVGIVIALAGVLLSRAEITEPACQAVVPQVTKSGMVFPKYQEFNEDATDMGVPKILNYGAQFVGDNCHIRVTEITLPILQNIVNKTAVKFGKDLLKNEDGSEPALDLSIAGVRVELSSEAHIIHVRPGTYVDIESYLDADCLKKWIGTTICLATKLR